MSVSRKVVDLCIGSAIVYLAIWVYELGNLAVLSSVGTQASLAFVGILPVGVSAVNPDPGMLAIAKPLQVLVCGAIMFAMLYSIRSRGLPVSTMVASATLSIYLASSYWEVLSLVGSSSYMVHLGVFTLIALAAQLVISRTLKV